MMYILVTFGLQWIQNGIRPEMCLDKDKADFELEGQSPKWFNILIMLGPWRKSAALLL